MSNVIHFGHGGSVRKLFDTADRQIYGAIPRRATHIKIVETGPKRGLFYIDCSPLGPAYQSCLTRLFEDYQEAVQYEQDWINQCWVGDVA